MEEKHVAANTDTRFPPPPPGESTRVGWGREPRPRAAGSEVPKA